MVDYSRAGGCDTQILFSTALHRIDPLAKTVIEYTWDILFTTMFVQLATAFISDWFWLVGTIPPSVGCYFLWTMVIYPWISKPDEPREPMPGQGQDRKAKVKYGKAR